MDWFTSEVDIADGHDYVYGLCLYGLIADETLQGEGHVPQDREGFKFRSAKDSRKEQEDQIGIGFIVAGQIVMIYTKSHYFKTVTSHTFISTNC